MANPVNRVTGILGLIMIGVIAYQTTMGHVSLLAAGQRAAITMLAVIVVRRLGNFGMSALAGSMERQAAAAAPARRATDPVETEAF